jgi:hypothetical protein
MATKNFLSLFRTQSTLDFSVAEHYSLRNTMCLRSKDVASGLGIRIGLRFNDFLDPDPEARK